VAVTALPPIESAAARTGWSVAENTLMPSSADRQSDSTPEKSRSSTAEMPSAPARSTASFAAPPAASEKPRAAAVRIMMPAAVPRLPAAFAHALFASGAAFRSSRANESATSCPSVPARYGCASPVTALRSAASSRSRCASVSAAPADRHRASGSSKTAARIFIRFFIIPSIP